MIGVGVECILEVFDIGIVTEKAEDGGDTSGTFFYVRSVMVVREVLRRFRNEFLDFEAGLDDEVDDFQVDVCHQSVRDVLNGDRKIKIIRISEPRSGNNTESSSDNDILHRRHFSFGKMSNQGRQLTNRCCIFKCKMTLNIYFLSIYIEIYRI